jgi:hypothetical protein
LVVGGGDFGGGVIFLFVCVADMLDFFYFVCL